VDASSRQQAMLNRSDFDRREKQGVDSSTKEFNDLWGGAKFMFRLDNKLCRAGLGDERFKQKVYAQKILIVNQFLFNKIKVIMGIG
jgi:hypothetical protein